MGKEQKKPKEPAPWDRRPWPIEGDFSADVLYAAIGAALSEWERHDATLAFLFSAFVSTPPSKSARRAYSAIRTFEGRMEMMKAASGEYFDRHDNAHLLEEFKRILAQSLKFAERRNDIAHGCVEYFRPETHKPVPLPNTFGLFPSFAIFRNRKTNDDPTYCYTSPEIEFFRREFFKLREEAFDLCGEISKNAKLKAAQESSLGTLRQLYRREASRGPDENNQ